MMKINAMIENMQRDDWKDVRAIYGEGLATGLAAFMTSPPKWGAWNAGHLEIGRLVARDDNDENGGAIAGFAALSPVPDT
jgi:phosphinothricin acetyltransferase